MTFASEETTDSKILAHIYGTHYFLYGKSGSFNIERKLCMLKHEQPAAELL